MESAVYSRRSSVLDKGEWTWTLDEAGIRESNPRGDRSLIRWEDVAQVRLAFAPTEYKPWRHLLELKLRSGGALTIDNAHFRGVADFEDRSAAYRRFVEAVMGQLRLRRPNVKVRIGSSPSAYWLQMGFVAAALALAGGLLMTLQGPDIPGIVWIKLAIIAVGMPVLFVQWARSSYPRSGDIDSIPASALPGGR
jgi:hypothetical protein